MTTLSLARPRNHLFVTNPTPDPFCGIWNELYSEWKGIVGMMGNGRDDFKGELWRDLGELRVFEMVGE